MATHQIREKRGWHRALPHSLVFLDDSQRHLLLALRLCATPATITGTADEARQAQSEVNGATVAVNRMQAEPGTAARA
ncbi:MAG: hypothetical protein ACREV7_12660 [Steroidobacteraceae bacterium]